jgi:type III secretion system FlhB-like substrate exporter
MFMETARRKTALYKAVAEILAFVYKMSGRL